MAYCVNAISKQGFWHGNWWMAEKIIGGAWVNNKAIGRLNTLGKQSNCNRLFIGVFPYHVSTFGVQRTGERQMWKIFKCLFRHTDTISSKQNRALTEQGLITMNVKAEKVPQTHSDTPQSHKHWPAKLLDGADIDDSVVKVVHKLWHVLVEEPLVRMHRVTCRKRNHRTWL